MESGTDDGYRGVKTAFGYIRVSTDKQAEFGVSLDAQKQRIETYCSLHDLDLLDLMEDASSAKSIDGRPSMKRLIKMARNGAVDAVITCKLDRMFRNTVEAITIIPELQALGVATHILDMGGVSLDTSTPMGGFFLTMAAAFAEMERKQIAERTRIALRHKRDHGLQYSRIPPYGWKYTEGKMVEAPAEQAALFSIMNLNRSGATLARIAETMSDEGRKTRGGKCVWQPGTIGKIIKNPMVMKKFAYWRETHAADSSLPHGVASIRKATA